MKHDNFHIFSGGPGAGKTTLLEALRDHGHVCVDEAARRVLKEQAMTGGNATHDGDRARYRDLMLAHGLADYRAMSEITAPVFFDRAIPELSGFGNAPGESDPPALTEAIAECRYGDAVFVFPPWLQIYTHDEERKHTFSRAVAVFVEVGVTYRRFGYRTVEVPCVTVEERLRFVLEHIGAL